MKKFLILLFTLTLATCWVSCSDDDDKNEPDPTIPTMNEITLTIKVESGDTFSLFDLQNMGGVEEEEEYYREYLKIPSDWEVNWGDGNITNSTNHTYTNSGTYLVTIKGTGLTAIVLCYYFTLQDIDVTKAPNLMILDIGENYKYEIDKLDVSNNKALRYLSCSYIGLTSLDLSNNTKLEWLWCGANELTSLDVSKNTELTDLDCGANELTSLDVSKNTELETLYCDDNELTSLDVSKNTELTELDCSGNKLTSLNLSKNTKLDELYCSGNQLTSLDLSKNTELTELDCGYNQLTSLDLSKNTELTELDCRNNPFTQESVNALLNSLPMGKYRDGEPISNLIIDDKWDVSIAKEKGWEVRHRY